MERFRVTKRLLICFVLVAAGCTTILQPIPTLSFAEAYRAVENLPPDSYIDEYEYSWNDFNNSRQLDQRDGCCEKSEEPIQQVLVLDSSGTVVQYVSDVDTPRSRCFRNTYMGVKFPKPPIAPYYKYALMR